MSKRKIIKVLLMILLFGSDVLAADMMFENEEKLKKLSLEELMEIPITSVSKKEERAFNAAAAVFVITGEEIRRSGFNSIPEALRMAPGIQVAQKTSNVWAISSRGFNGEFSNKLLILIDGRSVYNTVFAGVFWDMKDVVMEDIKRIEVIRGPGATLWGANAVNGVINIITKNSKETQGGLIAGGGGNQEKGFGTVRYGNKLGNNATYKVFAKYLDRDAYENDSGNDAFDDWDVARGGFRIDWNLTDQDFITFDGDYFEGDSGTKDDNLVTSAISPFVSNEDNSNQFEGGHFLALWKRNFSDGSNFRAQFYFDREIKDFKNLIRTEVDTYDFEFQHQFDFTENQEIVWGVNNRTLSDSYGNSFSLIIEPNKRVYNHFSFFVQDDISLVKDRLKLILGSKFTFNRFSGFDPQPNIRLAWTPNEKNTVWGSVSRAVRTPSRLEDGDLTQIRIAALSSANGLPIITSVVGINRYDSEKLTAYELGYRVQPTKNLLFDLTGFLNHYEDFRSSSIGSFNLETSPSPFLLLPLLLDNTRDEDVIGMEAAAKWNIFDFWKLDASVTLLNASSDDIDDIEPDYQWQVRSYLNLPYDLELDLGVYYVDELRAQSIPDYTRFDLRLGWAPVSNIDVSLIVQNLQDSEHLEFKEGEGASLFQNTLVQRSIFGKLTFKF
jgi:iron complex outermembrane recepter protein